MSVISVSQYASAAGVRTHLVWRPTFLWTEADGVRRKVALLGAQLVDAWEDATCHVVESFSDPGQRVSWMAKLNGHLVITKALAAGPWVQNLGLVFIASSLS